MKLNDFAVIPLYIAVSHANIARTYFRHLLNAVPAFNARFDFFWYFHTPKTLNLHTV